MTEQDSVAVVPVARQQVLVLMSDCGGAFVSRLAKAWLRADLANSGKLMAAFGDVYAKYAAMLEVTA